MFLTMGDLMMGALEVGATARGAFTAALPSPPVRHMWERIPGTGETPPGGGLITYLYRLVRYEEDPEPIDVSKLLRTEKEITAEVQKEMPVTYTPLWSPTETAPSVAPEPEAPSFVSPEPGTPWYKRPVVIGGVGLGVVVIAAAILLLKD